MVDLLLVKPIQRWALLLYKYLGGLTFVFLRTLMQSAASGWFWASAPGSGPTRYPAADPHGHLFLAILYAISTFVGVMTRSTISAIMLTIGAWFAFFIIGTVYQVFNNQRIVEEDAEKKGRPFSEEMRAGGTALLRRRFSSSTPSRRALPT